METGVPASSSRTVPEVASAALAIPTCSISSLLDSDSLGNFSGVVLDPVTNEILFDRGADTLLPPASVNKIVTGVAALSALGPDTTSQPARWQQMILKYSSCERVETSP